MCSGIGETWRLTGARRVAAGLDGVGAHAPRDLHQRRAGLGASVDPAGIDLRFSQWFARRLTPCAGWAARRYERGTVRARVHHGAARLSASSVGGSKLAPIVGLPQRSRQTSRTRGREPGVATRGAQHSNGSSRRASASEPLPAVHANRQRATACTTAPASTQQPARRAAVARRRATRTTHRCSCRQRWGHGSAARRTSGQTSTVTAPGFRQPRHGSRRGPPDRSGQAMSR